MAVSLAPTFAADKTTVLFLTPENLGVSLALLPDAVRQAVAELPKLTDADNQELYRTPTSYFLFLGLGSAASVKLESLRSAITKAVSRANEQKANTLQLVLLKANLLPDSSGIGIAMGEIPLLANYQFLLYKSDKKANSLSDFTWHTDLADAAQLLIQGQALASATNTARDLVNEPPNVLTSPELARRAEALGQTYGFNVTVLEKERIKALKMGGLLAVNMGSPQPPTFTILEWKPENARNTKPYVLVGKGIVFDTGGLSLKPTPGSMDSMKCDMAGAAAVIGAFVALAANKAPVHVVGLIPATDNRPGGDAYTPNDVITMHSGTTVEVLNTDAEGRMILADALSFAKQYDPALVVDLATLTGAAVIAVGTQATAFYSTADDTTTTALHKAAERTYERVVQFPLWDEYGELIKSDIADLKNVGGRYAGSITAAKFLQHFTAYPWMHLDIAGPAYLDKGSAYRPKNGTGVGVRLLYDFLVNQLG